MAFYTFRKKNIALFTIVVKLSNYFEIEARNKLHLQLCFLLSTELHFRTKSELDSYI